MDYLEQRAHAELERQILQLRITVLKCVQVSLGEVLKIKDLTLSMDGTSDRGISVALMNKPERLAWVSLSNDDNATVVISFGHPMSWADFNFPGGISRAPNADEILSIGPQIKALFERKIADLAAKA